MQQNYIATVLANGQSKRWGGNVSKSLAQWKGQSLIEHVIQRLKEQSCPPGQIWINSSAESVRQHLPDHIALPDWHEAQNQGPLSGMLSALHKAPEQLHLFVPTDTPLLPLELAKRLHRALASSDGVAAVASVRNLDSKEPAQVQPCCCLIKGKAWPNLVNHLEQNNRSVLSWLKKIKAIEVEFDASLNTCFVNLNEPAQLQGLQEHLHAHCLHSPRVL